MIMKIVDKTRVKFNVSMVEIADTNLWQKGRIGYAVMGINKDHVQVAIENIQKYIESLYAGEIIDSWTEIIVMGNEI